MWLQRSVLANRCWVVGCAFNAKRPGDTGTVLGADEGAELERLLSENAELRLDRESLKKCRGLLRLRTQPVEAYRVIEAERATNPIKHVRSARGSRSEFTCSEGRKRRGLHICSGDHAVRSVASCYWICAALRCLASGSVSRAASTAMRGVMHRNSCSRSIDRMRRSSSRQVLSVSSSAGGTSWACPADRCP
jgi:hypothetical protein